MSILEVEEGRSVYVKINKFGTFECKNGDEIPKFDVLNLMTGEEQTMWLDGGMKGQFSQIGGFEKAIGKSFEFKKTGQKTIEMEGEKVKVNTYDIYEIDAD